MSKKIGILTGGGDCPGLNAVIRAVVRKSIRLDYQVIGLLQVHGNKELRLADHDAG